jgi:hypothetical protein
LSVSLGSHLINFLKSFWDLREEWHELFWWTYYVAWASFLTLSCWAFSTVVAMSAIEAFVMRFLWSAAARCPSFAYR